MTSLAILSIVITAASLAYTMSIRIWRQASARIDASSSASTALTRSTMGIGGGFGLRAAFLPVLITGVDDNWQIRFTTPAGMSGDATTANTLTYSAGARTLTYQSGNAAPTVIGRNIVESSATQQGDAITLTVRAQSRAGYTNVTYEMSTVITPRNRS
jgi:hypothetical protein